MPKPRARSMQRIAEAARAIAEAAAAEERRAGEPARHESLRRRRRRAEQVAGPRTSDVEVVSAEAITLGSPDPVGFEILDRRVGHPVRRQRAAVRRVNPSTSNPWCSNPPRSGLAHRRRTTTSRRCRTSIRKSQPSSPMRRPSCIDVSQSLRSPTGARSPRTPSSLGALKRPHAHAEGRRAHGGHHRRWAISATRSRRS